MAGFTILRQRSRPTGNDPPPAIAEVASKIAIIRFRETEYQASVVARLP
jgi:hypothetical protein